MPDDLFGIEGFDKLGKIAQIRFVFVLEKYLKSLNPDELDYYDVLAVRNRRGVFTVTMSFCDRQYVVML